MVKLTVTVAAVVVVCQVLVDVGSSQPDVSFSQREPFLRHEGSAESDIGFRPAGNNTDVPPFPRGFSGSFGTFRGGPHHPPPSNEGSLDVPLDVGHHESARWLGQETDDKHEPSSGRGDVPHHHNNGGQRHPHGGSWHGNGSVDGRISPPPNAGSNDQHPAAGDEREVNDPRTSAKGGKPDDYRPLAGSGSHFKTHDVGAGNDTEAK
ncbi:hypothetical protein PI124_g17723 [Phytophthora idaei]|nr:hypothetical protein PI125_g18096 [Phytophthora idaei]KAG3139632.1 hypothetical protein PI126_g16374 [Phytophthora idaei]KAG3237290.1 hypothetical protein PI124_g17723 [Phytophthora idaei]